MNKQNVTFIKETFPPDHFMLPVHLFKVVLQEGTHDLYLHWHEEMEMILIVSGEGEFQVGLKPYPVSRGDIVLIAPGTLHSGRGNVDAPLQCEALVFDLNMLKDLHVDIINLKYIEPLLNQNMECSVVLRQGEHLNGDLTNSLRQIISLHENRKPGYELEMKACFFHVFARLFGEGQIIENRTSPTLTDKKISHIKHVIEYIREHSHRPLSIDELAQVSGYSKFYFIRFFKEHTGLTCTQYINLIRLDKAAQLLADTSRSIMDISLEAGYESVSYFIKNFKKKFSLTPHEYRKANASRRGVRE